MNSEGKWHLRRAIQSAPDSCRRLCGDGKVRRVCSGHSQSLHLKLARLGGWNGRDLIEWWHTKTQRRRASGIRARQRCDICESSIFLPHTPNTPSTPKKLPHSSLLSNTQRVQMSPHKDGLLSTCSVVIPFKVSVQVQKYWWAGERGARLSRCSLKNLLCDLQEWACQRPRPEENSDNQLTPHAEVTSLSKAN